MVVIQDINPTDNGAVSLAKIEANFQNLDNGKEEANPNIQSHISNTSNPHNVTKAQVGLANVDNTSDATKNSATATLTNKTISGANNTLSNIPQSAVTNLATDLSGKAGLASNNTFTSTGNTSFAGNVGIGTTSPGAKLHAYQAGAGVIATIESGGEYTALKLLNNSGGASDWELRSNDNMNLSSPYNTFSINAGSPYNPAFMIQSNLNATFYGNVGINKTAPLSKFAVVGLPTSSVGLTSGDVWRNGTVLNIIA